MRLLAIAHKKFKYFKDTFETRTFKMSILSPAYTDASAQNTNFHCESAFKSASLLSGTVTTKVVHTENINNFAFHSLPNEKQS